MGRKEEIENKLRDLERWDTALGERICGSSYEELDLQEELSDILTKEILAKERRSDA